jgi:DnaJ-class molecular chaperone
MSAYEQPCDTCEGAGGRTETVQDGGTVRQTWVSCSTCHGRGTR